MKLFEEINAQEMLDFLQQQVIMEMKHGKVAAAAKITALMAMIEEAAKETAKETAKEKGLDR